MNFYQLIVKLNLHRLLATYQKYFDRFFLDTIKVKIGLGLGQRII